MPAERTVRIAKPIQHGDAAAPAMTALPAGTKIRQWEVIRTLGRGGMGHVYLARDLVLGRRVAIKFLIDHQHGAEPSLLDEARATARCQHENIVIVHDVDEHERHPFVVFEYLEGETLGHMLERGPIGLEHALELAVAIARALAHAHAEGIVHRDLKPDNVIVTEAGVVKVLDFGIASTGLANADEAGTILGTPAFMAPEQLRGEVVDGRADVWALGVMLYQLLTGRHPLGESCGLAKMLAFATDPDRPCPRVRTTAPELPVVLAELLERCLAKPAGERADSAAVLATLEALGGARSRLLADDECPYAGLAAFEERDADRFFGRAADVRRAIAKLAEVPLVGIVGPSGAGKSSLVRAGVGPALSSGPHAWDVRVTRPGRDPIAALAELARDAASPISPERLRSEPGLLAATLRAHARATGRRVLVFVDQFEELYTLASPADRGTTAACLTAIADDVASPLRVVIALRADFTERLTDTPALLAQLSRGLLFLGPLDREGLRDALVRPAALAGYRFDPPSLVDDMLAALDHAPSALPLLQFTAARLWDGRDVEQHALTAARYLAMGGVAGAIASHADHVVAALPAVSQRQLRGMFRRLVTPERTRALADVGELCEASDDPAGTRALVDELVRARLLVLAGDAEAPVVEIVHESLITAWPLLRRWLDEEHELIAFEAQLRAAAKPWDDRGRPQGLLWRGDALAEARVMRARMADRPLPARDKAFLDAAIAHDDRARRTRRIATWSAFGALALVAAGAIVAMLWIRGAERTGRRAAEQARAEAEHALDAERARADAEHTAEVASAKARTEQAGREQAEATARGATRQVELKDHDLAEVNQRLAASLDELRREAARTSTALEATEHEATRAHRAEVELEAKRVALEKLLGEREAEVRRLEQQLRKISVELR